MIKLLFFFFFLINKNCEGNNTQLKFNNSKQINENKYKQTINNKCYNDSEYPQRCVTNSQNIAYQKNIEISPPEFTCGVKNISNFCLQYGNICIVSNVCDICDNNNYSKSHPPSFLTDFNDPHSETWWQSITMEEGINQNNNIINLTLKLGKSFDISSIRIKFASPRPESLIIYKKTRESSPWIVWQYFSSSCKETFGISEQIPIYSSNKVIAKCSKEYSNITPLCGGDVIFSTLEEHSSINNFEENEILQEWITATEIKMKFFNPRNSFRTYYYAITDIAINGKCKCNGHSNECVCVCQHNTGGIDCNECLPFYMDRPWKPATSLDANECLPCNCSGLSEKCFFDSKLFEKTGHGGHCFDCVGYTEGPNCERCIPNYWRSPLYSHYCQPCNCNLNGSLNNGQCNEKTGECICKEGVEGKYCNKCKNGYYGFGPNGCKECKCNLNGTIKFNDNNNNNICSPIDGQCFCKKNVEGEKCDRCKPGYFLIENKNSFGCSPCFCFGHSSICEISNKTFIQYNITSNFTNLLINNDGWKAEGIEKNGNLINVEVKYNYKKKAIFTNQQCTWPIYFIAPSKFLGDQRFSYGKYLYFSYHKLTPYAPWSNLELQLIGNNGNILSLPFSSQQNLNVSTKIQNYKFKLHSDPKFQWNPQLNEINFIHILSNLSKIRIRATFSQGDVGYLFNFALTSIKENIYGSLSKCIPCECNGHSSICNPENGICYCKHNTTGNTCERCSNGFYGDALAKTSKDCKPCNCPGGGSCIFIQNQIICTECPEGYSGPRCEFCAEDYFGDPLKGKPCKKCNCNGNIDLNNIRQCDSLTGQCLKCIYSTTGFNCEKCLPVIGKRCEKCEIGCQPCECDPLGSLDVTECNQITGQCKCKPGVIGKNCNKCQFQYFGLNSKGCTKCSCNKIGSEHINCDIKNGQCLCHNLSLY
ncbi:putative effector protein [Meloidogyne graminicola]|uniref:Putative effector protein n=1 Tax=Meloidogyne graminicola TaxID=189291 RepID=A0A8S9ZYJ8_9BILA|nr:putative effector protein [Meloidogyne graminicola]